MADDNVVNQEEIERLLDQVKEDAPSGAPEEPAPVDESAEPLARDHVESLSGGSPGGGGDGERPGAAEPKSSETANATSSPHKPDSPSPAPEETLAHPLPGKESVAQGDVEYLLNQAERALESIGAVAGDDMPEGVSAFHLEEFSGAPASTEKATLDLIRDVELDLKIELGRTHMYLEDVLKLRKGSVVPLDKLAGDPVDIYVNGRLIARGEVLVLNDNFCVRVAELIAGANVFT